MKSIVHRLILILVLSFVLIGPAITVKASSENIVLHGQKILPGSVFYNFKRLWEKGRDFLAFSPEAKVEYHRKLLNTRLSEFKYVMENKQLNEIEKASNRVSYEAGIIEENLEKFEDQEKRAQVAEEFETYKDYIPRLRDIYPANSAYWLSTQQNIDTFNILMGKLK